MKHIHRASRGVQLHELREKYGQDMTGAQCAHVERIIEDFAEAVYKKYAAGQKEHGGDLWLKPIVPQAIMEEALDMVVYASTLLEQLRMRNVVLGDFEPPKER